MTIHMTDAEKIKIIKAIEEKYRRRIRALVAEQRAILKRAILRHEEETRASLKKTLVL